MRTNRNDGLTNDPIVQMVNNFRHLDGQEGLVDMDGTSCKHRRSGFGNPFLDVLQYGLSDKLC